MSEYEMRLPRPSVLPFLGGACSTGALRSDTVVSKRDLLTRSRTALDNKADITGEEKGFFGVLDWNP